MRSPQRKRRWLRVLYLLLGLAGAYLFMCYSLAGSYLSPSRAVAADRQGLEEEHLPSEAGPTPAFVTPGLGKGKVLFVFAHGYGGNRDHWTDLMRGLDAAGYDAIAPAMPGQDASPDKTVGFGGKEADVLLGAIRWAKTRYEEPPRVVVVGLSLGSGAAWLASELAPDEVDAVVSDAGFARFDEAMKQFFETSARGSSVYLRPVVWIAQSRSGLKPAEVVPERAAEKWRGRPALVIHGQNDRLFPVAFSERLAKASGADLWVVPGSDHPSCYLTQPEEYTRRLVTLAKRLEARPR